MYILKKQFKNIAREDLDNMMGLDQLERDYGGSLIEKSINAFNSSKFKEWDYYAKQYSNWDKSWDKKYHKRYCSWKNTQL